MPAAVEPIRLIQMAEQLEGPEEVLRTTYSNSTWQNQTFDTARSVSARRPRTTRRMGIVARSIRLPGRGNDERRRHPQSGPPIHREPRSRTLLVQFRARQSRRSGQPPLSRGRPQPLVHAAALSHRLAHEQRHPDAVAGSGIRRKLLPSRLRGRPRFTASTASLGLLLRWTPAARPSRWSESSFASAPHSQPHSARNVLLLQPLGAIPEPRTAPVCPIRGSAIHPRRSQHDRQRANGPILVSSRRRLCRRTARRRSRSQRGAGAPGVRADHTISLRSHLDSTT